MYVARANSDSNQGRPSAPSCPCHRLLVVDEHLTFDGARIQWLMCPRCQSGWVRESSR